MTPNPAIVPSANARPDERTLRILAKSVFRELKTAGYAREDIVVFTSTLLEMVTSDLKVDAS